MSRPNDAEWKALLDFARHFSFDSVCAYMREVEYADWMTEIMDNPDAEMFSHADLIRINEILLDAFEQAHRKRLDYWTRYNLVHY